ncbi:MAG: saccharopine dehydrogenase NADP-binding domain-containing protein [Planctomycetes bacterium]|nr:saccharopine dehydrogenase NADP-binding domain-containing protein [Planctomycetota bacterium]
MRRIVVLGAGGYFGAAVATLLRRRDLAFVPAGRRKSAAAMHVDAEDARSLREALREGDVVIDAAGPFQKRSAALFEAAIEKRFDVVDLSDCLAYARTAFAMAPRFERSGIRVVTACSSVSAVSAALVRATGVRDPAVARVFLAAASRRSARYGTSASAFDSVGRSIDVWRNGEIGPARGWGEPRAFDFPAPFGRVTARLVESPDAIFLPRAFPSLRAAEFRAATRIRGLDVLLSVAARIPPLLALARLGLSPGTVALMRFLGRDGGAVGVEVEGADGVPRTAALCGAVGAHFIAAMPAALAAVEIAAGRVAKRGLLDPGGIVGDREMFRELEREGVGLTVAEK